jgi:hypothetical protein
MCEWVGRFSSQSGFVFPLHFLGCWVYLLLADWVKRRPNGFG